VIIRRRWLRLARKGLDIYGRSNDDSVAVIVLFNLGGGVVRNRDELIGELGGSEIGLAKGLDEKFESETDEWVKDPKAGVLNIFVVHLPIILRWDVTITEVASFMVLTFCIICAIMRR